MRNGANEPRILLIGQQQSSSTASRALANGNHFEAEDVLASCSSVEHLSFQEVESFGLSARRRIGSLLRSRRPGLTLPAAGSRSIHLDRDYDMAIVMVRTAWDVTLLETIADLRQRAGVVVLWALELWPSGVTSELARAPFHLADLVFTGTTVEGATALDQAVETPVHFMPAGIDIDTFAPTDLDAPRPIGLLNIGRRDQPLHELLLASAKTDRWGYEFDTTNGARLGDHAEHRWRLAQTFRWSNVAMTSAAKFDVADGIDAGVGAVPNRVYEALAAGCVLVGSPAPAEAGQRDQLGDVVVNDLPSDPTDAVTSIRALIDDDLTLERRRNVQLARRSDWSVRWLRLFDAAGIAPPDEMVRRRDRLLGSEQPID